MTDDAIPIRRTRSPSGAQPAPEGLLLQAEEALRAAEAMLDATARVFALIEPESVTSAATLVQLSRGLPRRGAPDA